MVKFRRQRHSLNLTFPVSGIIYEPGCVNSALLLRLNGDVFDAALYKVGTSAKELCWSVL